MNTCPAAAEYADRLAYMTSEGWAANFTYSKAEFLCTGVATREGFEPVKVMVTLGLSETEHDAVYRCIGLLEKRTLMENVEVSAELGKVIEEQYAGQPARIMRSYLEMLGYIPEHIKQQMQGRP
jgi:hypothetical protein